MRKHIIYMYPLMERQPGSDRTILTWSRSYAHDNDTVAGTVHIATGHTEYYWKAGGDREPDTASLVVLERK